MTLHKLSQLYWLNREIESLTRRLEELRLKAYAPATPNLSGMPSAHSNTSGVERVAAEIAELEELIEKKRAELVVEEKILRQYINDVPDSLTRQIMAARFVDGLSWQQVAIQIGGITSDAARMICKRYIATHDD